MDPASLPAGALEHAADRSTQASVSIADDEPDAVESAVLEVAEELGPERLALRVADVDPEDLAVAVGPDNGGDDHGLGDDLPRFADVDVGRIQPYVDERQMVQPPLPQDGDVLIDELADARPRRLAHAAVAAERLDQVVDLPRGGSGDVGAHDHRPQSLVDAVSWLEQLREERPFAQLGDPDLDITRRRRQELASVPVALRGADRRSLARLGTDPGRQLRLDQLLQRHGQDVGDRGGQTRGPRPGGAPRAHGWQTRTGSSCGVSLCRSSETCTVARLLRGPAPTPLAGTRPTDSDGFGAVEGRGHPKFGRDGPGTLVVRWHETEGRTSRVRDRRERRRGQVMSPSPAVIDGRYAELCRVGQRSAASSR